MPHFNTVQQVVQWLQARGATALCTDSRRLQTGQAFLAWPGAAFDARSQVGLALADGALACVIEAEGACAWPWLQDERVASLAGLKALSGVLASQLLGQPSQRLKVLAITGTNGKTSTAWWLAQALSNQKLPVQMPCGLIGTLGIGIPPQVVSTGLTTPDPVVMQSALADMVQQGLQACAIEASSIGLQEQRLAGMRIDTAVFTNLTQDHLDYHGSMADYWMAKQALFDWPGLRCAVVNVDDARGAELADRLTVREAAGLQLWRVSMHNPHARLWAKDIEHTDDGVCFTVVEAADSARVQTRLMGAYNVANVLGVMATLRGLGVTLADAARVCADLSAVPGRMQFISQPQRPLVVVDYAHTPDALAQALQALQALAQRRRGQLWCAFGCGGDRDPTKRPIMGAMAARFADRVLVTSDNPRSEEPDAIISQILLGLSGVADVLVEPDRARAIRCVLHRAQAQDVILLAGKGHEDYQEVQGKRWPFSDVQQVQQALDEPLEVLQTEATCQRI